MAVARAQAKGGGVSGIHIWLIVFVALWLTSTVLLVLLYTDQKDLVSKNDDLRRAQQDSRKELGEANAALATVAETATGEPNDTPDLVRTKLKELCARIADDDLVPDALAFQDTAYLEALSTLYESFKIEHEKLARALTGNGELGARVEELASANADQKTAFDNQIAGIERDLDELKASWEDYARKRDQEVDDFDQKLADADVRANTDIQEQRNENKRLASKFDELQNRYGELKERLGELQITPQELITARQADGHVVMAKPGEEVVYIDLGRDAGLVLGLQFAVYSAGSGIAADGLGKARIEVVNIFDSAAECRIAERHGREPILEGDLIANPVFDRERSLQFVVIGRFDVDGDGQLDTEGTGQVESLVESWGGTVAQILSARVDFLVVGDAPPRRVLVGDPTPEAQARHEAAKKLRDDYDEALAVAQALSIPILTRDVLMHFLGYVG